MARYARHSIVTRTAFGNFGHQATGKTVTGKRHDQREGNKGRRINTLVLQCDRQQPVLRSLGDDLTVPTVEMSRHRFGVTEPSTPQQQFALMFTTAQKQHKAENGANERQAHRHDDAARGLDVAKKIPWSQDSQAKQAPCERRYEDKLQCGP